jgi:hypothetical protein
MTTYATEQEAMAAATARSAELAESLDTVEFDGQNCEDAWDEGADCDGWDGNDRRCECGNRRVSWAFSEHPKGVWSFYAEAY